MELLATEMMRRRALSPRIAQFKMSLAVPSMDDVPWESNETLSKNSGHPRGFFRENLLIFFTNGACDERGGGNAGWGDSHRDSPDGFPR